MSACLGKRKLEENDQSASDTTQCIGSPSPRKKLKLDNKRTENTEIEEMDASFDIQIGSDAIVQLFASNTVNNVVQNADDTYHILSSLKIGKSDWKFELFQLPTDPKDHLYQFLDGLFGDKLCDWKEYIDKNNNFVSVIKDNLGIWRGAILFIIYEIHWKHKPQKQNHLKYLIKIPLAGVDLHFRRQNVGSVLVNYTVSIIHKIMQQKAKIYEIIVLVIDETQAKSFWKKNEYIPVRDRAMDDYRFDTALLIKKGFVLDIETELIVMMYKGDKTMDLVLNNTIVDAFETPKYVNFGQRYCKKHEIEEHEKDMKEWQKKKKELDEKRKHKKDDDDDSDEDFDYNLAEKLLSSDDDEDDDVHYTHDNDDNVTSIQPK